MISCCSAGAAQSVRFFWIEIEWFVGISDEPLFVYVLLLSSVVIGHPRSSPV